jgi:uncharacterized glyoxalase superfamily protein PhnB
MKVHEVFAYLHVKDAASAIDFYTRAFGAEEKFRLVDPASGKVGHAELMFDGIAVMLSDEFPEYGIQGPQSAGHTSVSIHLHVDDADAMIARAAALGAEILNPPQNHFYGERSGTVRDPFGHRWNIGHQLEDVSPEEMQRRYDKVGNAG